MSATIDNTSFEASDLPVGTNATILQLRFPKGTTLAALR